MGMFWITYGPANAKACSWDIPDSSGVINYSFNGYTVIPNYGFLGHDLLREWFEYLGGGVGVLGFGTWVV